MRKKKSILSQLQEIHNATPDLFLALQYDDPNWIVDSINDSNEC